MGRLRMEDQRVERLIQEHLIRGFCLMQKKPCPACRTPLVRQSDDASSVASWPIPGIAYCVKCDAHVVSHVSEVNLLEAYEKKQKNTSFYVASQSSNASSKRDAASSDGSSGILETSKESITDTQKAYHVPKRAEKRITLQPSVPGALIVDPIEEDRKRRQQPQIKMPTAPTLVEPSHWWRAQQEYIQRALHGLVETTSDASANSGFRTSVQEGVVVGSNPTKPTDPVGCVVDGTDLVPTDSSGSRADPPLEEARTEDSMSRHSNTHDDSVDDPPSRLVVPVDSFHEEQKQEEQKQKQEKQKQEESTQTDSASVHSALNHDSTSQPPSIKEDKTMIEKQREILTSQETPKYKNTIKKTLRKSAFRRRPQFLNTVCSTDDSIDPPKKEKPHEADDVLSGGTLSLDEFIAAVPLVSMHPKETALTEQISGHNKDIVRESERLEHLKKMKEESIQHKVPIDIQNEIVKGIEVSEKAKVKAEAKVQKLQQERSEVEAERILSFLEEELKEKQTEAIFADKLAKDAYDRLTRARLEVAHGLAVEVPLGVAAQTEDTVVPSPQNGTGSLQKQNRDQADDGAQAPAASSTDPWELLREEGRSALTRRLIAGWHVSLEQCHGSECHKFPLLSHDGHSYCAVCGGSGNGLDGAYDINLRDESTLKSRQSEESGSRKAMVDEQTARSEANSSRKTTNDGLASSVATKSLKAIQDEFDAKRKLASKEIGARMRQGWMLLDMTCQGCMMPLLTDMSQECVLCVLCGIQSGHLNNSQVFHDEEADEAQEVQSDSSRYSGSPSAKRSIHFEDTSHDAIFGDSFKQRTSYSPKSIQSTASIAPSHRGNHDTTYEDSSKQRSAYSPKSFRSTASVAPSHHRGDPPPANNYDYSRRPLSPAGRMYDDLSVRSYREQSERQKSIGVIVVEDAERLMSERRYNTQRRQYRHSRADHQMKHFSPSWDADHKAIQTRRSSSPSFSVASAPQYGNPSKLVADPQFTRRNYPVHNSSRYEPELVSVRSNQSSRYSRSSRRKDGWSDRSVGSSRSHHHRAPSPGLSAAVLPSAASSVYTGTSRTVKMTTRHPQPRLNPENWAGQTKRGGQHSRSMKKSGESFRPIPATSEGHSSAKIIDVEPIRRWQEGREDVIIVESKKEVRDEKGLEELLSRIEKTKAQIEERSQSPESRETQLKGLVDNLARSVQQLREIERR